jgi:pyruvate dehydrogenase (quinone)
MAGTTAAELLVDVLVDAGVKRTYRVAEDSLNGIAGSMHTRNEIRWIGVRHEESAVRPPGVGTTTTRPRAPMGVLSN